MIDLPSKMSFNDSSCDLDMSLDELFVFSVSDFILGDKDSPHSPNAGADQVRLSILDIIIFVIKLDFYFLSFSNSAVLNNFLSNIKVCQFEKLFKMVTDNI